MAAVRRLLAAVLLFGLVAQPAAAHPPADAAGPAGFGDAVGVGFAHFATGADHLLFLLLLLVAARGRFLRVALAFGLGHSITLALAGLGLVRVPAAPVELLILVSVAIAAVHAVRPVVRDGEVYLATGFGLVHGLAFAASFGAGGSLVPSLLGFNVGIELAQLLAVALFVPALHLIRCASSPSLSSPSR